MVGYVFNFQGHGAFSPNGKVEMTPEQIEQHNSALMVQEQAAIKASGRALLYLFGDSVGQWASQPFQRTKILRRKSSVNNWGARRTDVWFRMDGSTWHGVNIGDNDIVRCKRNKD